MVAGLLRGALLTLIAQGVAWIVGVVSGGHDANIGAGLLAFAATVVASALWGLRDGRRIRSLRDGALTWVVAGIVHGVASAAFIQLTALLTGDGLDAGVALSDLVAVAPFLAALVAAPGAIGVALGSIGAPVPERG